LLVMRARRQNASCLLVVVVVSSFLLMFFLIAKKEKEREDFAIAEKRRVEEQAREEWVAAELAAQQKQERAEARRLRDLHRREFLTQKHDLEIPIVDTDYLLSEISCEEAPKEISEMEIEDQSRSGVAMITRKELQLWTPSNHTRPILRHFAIPPGEEKYIILYRILGNDLPPRHYLGQTKNNLLFILENEENFPRLRKRWIVNRIINKTAEREIISILNRYNQSYEVKEFYLTEWAECFKQNEHLGDVYWAPLNYARNYAIREGKKLGFRWILPFDGNEIITTQEFKKLEQDLKNAEINQCSVLTMPIKRTKVPNEEAVRMGWKFAGELGEPQLIFGNDSTLLFGNSMKWGEKPKLGLLQRLERRNDTSSYAKKFNYCNEPTSAITFRLWSGTTTEHRGPTRTIAKQDVKKALRIRAQQCEISLVGKKRGLGRARASRKIPKSSLIKTLKQSADQPKLYSL